MKEKKNVEIFFLYFSKTQGEHIKLFLKAPEDRIEKLLCIWDTWIDDFLKVNPTKASPINYPQSSMQFSNDSDMYDLYEPDASQTGLLSSSDLEIARCKISAAILDVLSLKPIDYENTLMFFLSLQLGIIRAAFQDKKEAASEIIAMLTYVLLEANPDHRAHIDDKINALYKGHEKLLTLIATEIYANEIDHSVISWLHDWINICGDLITRGKPFRHLFYQLSTVLHEHFDFYDLRELLITSCVIHRSLIELEQEVNGFYKTDEVPLAETILTCADLSQFGRLGNQLFRIASVFGIAKEHGYGTALPFWQYAPFFNIKSNTLVTIPSATIAELEFHHTPEFYQLLKNKKGVINLHGYFQSDKYWKSKNISFVSSFLTQIRNKYYFFTKPSIAIHIRRGDYVNNPDFYLLPENYYILALLNHFPDMKNYQIVLFTDDICFAKAHFEKFKNVHFSEGLNDVEDMALMSLCDNYILSNSTFAWWAAYLGQKKNSKVIYPAVYFQGSKKEFNMKDFWQPNWTAFDHTS